MLGVNQSDFMSYMSALKSNYRKGVHRMEAILSNPTHAKEFAANLGGVLGYGRGSVLSFYTERV